MTILYDEHSLLVNALYEVSLPKATEGNNFNKKLL